MKYYVNYFGDSFVATSNLDIVEQMSEFQYTPFDGIEDFVEQLTVRVENVTQERAPTEINALVGHLIKHNILQVEPLH